MSEYPDYESAVKREGLTPQERKHLRDVLNYSLSAEPDSLLRAIGVALLQMNPPIDSDEETNEQATQRPRSE